MQQFIRWISLMLAVGIESPGRAEEVAWLAEVQRPPGTTSSFDVGKMEPLMTLADGTSVASVETWRRRRQELETAWQTFLGPNLPAPTNTLITVLKTEQLENVSRSLIRYECEPNLFVEAYLLRPPGSDGVRRPGLVALHHTAQATIDEIAGISGPESRKLGLKLAQRGFVVICPRCFLWQDAASLTSAVETFRNRHPQSLGMRKMLFDAQRALDILSAQPDVDPKRIGAVGHSLGERSDVPGCV